MCAHLQEELTPTEFLSISQRRLKNVHKYSRENFGIISHTQ